mgnify:FL=1
MALDHEKGQDGSTEGEEEGVTDGETAEAVPVVGYAGRKSLQEVERLYEENKLRASDLDFWDMYPDEPERTEVSEMEEAGQKEDGEEGERSGAKYEEEAKRVEEEEIANDPSRDGKHTLLTYADGTEEWVLINPYLEQNTYDYTNLQMKGDKMSYYDNGRDISYLGLDLSKYNGDVDFTAVKSEGIDFVMIRLGSRGYGSGQITLDEKF